MGLRPKHGRPLDPRAVGARPADAPGGTYFSQQVGPASMAELSQAFLGPLLDADRWRRPQDARAAAVRAGLDVVNLRTATLRAEFHDVGVIVYLLRKCVWWVPGFSVERYLDTLHELHQRMTREGHSSPTPAAFFSKRAEWAGEHATDHPDHPPGLPPV